MIIHTTQVMVIAGMMTMANYVFIQKNIISFSLLMRASFNPPRGSLIYMIQKAFSFINSLTY